MFGSRSFVALERQRLKVIEQSTPPIDGRVAQSPAALQAFAALEQPLAFIARIRNSSTSRLDFTVVTDGVPICTTAVDPQAVRRVDCQGGIWSAGAVHSVSVDGPLADWTLEYLEVATHHGNTDGLIYLVILPAASPLGVRPTGGAVAAFSLLLGLVLFVVDRSPRRGALRAYPFVAVIVVLFLALVHVAPWISPYQVVVSAGTFGRCMALLCLPQLVTIWRWLMRPAVGRRAIVRPVLVAALVALGFAAVMRAQLASDHGGNYSGFLYISRAAFDGNPLMHGRDDIRRSLVLVDHGGYDGQFSYFCAFDPFMRSFAHDPRQYRSVVDAVPYRYGRIGFSVLTRLAAWDRWRWYPATMMWLVVVATGVASLALAQMAQTAGLSPLLGALILVVPGFWQSLQRGLPEPVAAAALLLGCWCLSRDRPLAASIAFAAAILIRETSILLVGSLAVAAMVKGDRRGPLRWAALAVAPMLLWRLYVGWILFPESGLRGFFDQARVLGAPFAGFVDLRHVVKAGTYYDGSPEFARAAFVYPALLVAGLAVALALAIPAPSAFSVAAVLYGGLAVALNYSMVWLHVGNGQRVTYELFLALALCLLTYRTYPCPWRYALMIFWIATTGYTLFGAFDAAALRAAAGLPV